MLGIMPQYYKPDLNLPDNRQIAALLHAAGIASGDYRIAMLAGGSNNRVYQLTDGQHDLLLKIYFCHPHDSRDRLRTEFEFCRYAWTRQLDWTPQALAYDAGSNMALYEFIPGRKISATEITQTSALHDALAFYLDLNRQITPDAARLPSASEACFSLDEHLRCIARRVERLKKIEPHDEVSLLARNFVSERLHPLWRETYQSVCLLIKQRKLIKHDRLPLSARCLSPSDFGFHNALLTASGRFRFIDFEYAGWDDPAKTVCDFFCQPSVPVPDDYHEEFCRQIAMCRADPDACLLRIKLLEPVYQLKWCCIMLNDFIKTDASRRSFAHGATGQPSRLREQLSKAVRMADRIVIS